MSDPSTVRKGGGIRSSRQNTERQVRNNGVRNNGVYGRVKGVKTKQTQQMVQNWK